MGGGEKPDSGGDKPQNGDDKPGGDKPNPPESLPVHFKVNGVELISQHDKLVALDILIMAGENGAIAGKPDGYFLQNMEGKKYKPDEWVQLHQGAEFLAMPEGPTPVANRLK